jgi:hypothetical protein
MASVTKRPNTIWLASYPRSGNTLLRTVLWQCFGLRSASIYPNDLGGNTELENYVGHIEHGPDGKIFFPEDGLPLIKTHGPPTDDEPSIYIVRDGRAASISLWQFYHEELPLNAVIAGQHRFGTWANHLAVWRPWERHNTLLIKYEEIIGNLPGILEDISAFLSRDILADRIADRDAIVSVDGRWVRSKSDQKPEISGVLLERFNEINGEMMQRMGYFS